MQILRLVLAAAALVLAGCAGAPGAAAESIDEPTAASATSTPAGPAPSSAGTGTPRPDEARASGGPLSVVAVRAAAQEGYDRVVFELDGDEPGEPGWFVSYVDAPSQQGSGSPVDVAGRAFLQVMVTGTGYPFDTGTEDFTCTLDPSGTAVVRQVVTGGVFEGQAQAFVGLSREQPFRVLRLADPPRVVLDVRTDG